MTTAKQSQTQFFVSRALWESELQTIKNNITIFYSLHKVMQVYRAKANKIGVTLKPSKNKDKKFAVYKDGIFQANIGQKGYKDYDCKIRCVPHIT